MVCPDEGATRLRVRRLLKRQGHSAQIAFSFDQHQGSWVQHHRRRALAGGVHRDRLCGNRSLYRGNTRWIGVYPLQTGFLGHLYQGVGRQGIAGNRRHTSALVDSCNRCSHRRGFGHWGRRQHSHWSYRCRCCFLSGRCIVTVDGLIVTAVRAVTTVLARATFPAIAVARALFTAFASGVTVHTGLGYLCACFAGVSVGFCKAQWGLSVVQRLAVLVRTRATLGAASTSTPATTTFAASLTSAFATVLTGLVVTFLRLRCGVYRSRFVAHLRRTLSVLAALAITRRAVASVTPVVTLRTLAAGSAVGALFVAASVLRASSLQTHVYALWLTFGIKTLAVALTLTL